jgi:hypothetical protein
MQQRNASAAAFSNHQFMSLVECEALERAIRDELLALPHADQSTRQKKKDIQTGKNKAPNTLATMLVGAFRKERSVPRVTRVAHAIIGFFESRGAKQQRRLRDLNPIETKEEGDLNNVQMAIAQGDLSTPTLLKLVEEIDEYAPVLQEMRSAALIEAMRVSQ